MQDFTSGDAFEEAVVTDVLIVGAGPVGLAAAIELGQRGISCKILEKGDRAGYAPRAKTTNVRTRTHLRRWGIAEKLAERSPMGVSYPTDVHFVTKLSGKLIASFENAFNGSPQKSDLYPEHAQWVPQYALEEVLRNHVLSLPNVELRFSSTLKSLEQDDDGVTAFVEVAGAPRKFRARYVIGADGARSTARDQIGATMEGRYGLSRNYNIVFRAPQLARAHQLPPGAMYWQINAAFPSLIGPMDREDIWFFMPTQVDEERDISEEEARAMIVAATGIDISYEILSSDFWVASKLLADRYRDRRVFLAGDACHLHPPFGGFGMNMGVGDAVDLGWKIAAVLQGWGGPRLLNSYEIERREVHSDVLEEAESNHSVLANTLFVPGLEDETPEAEGRRMELAERILAQKSREFYSLGTVLGNGYSHSPVILDDGVANPSDASRYVPSSVPGCLAPHFWWDENVSLYDRLGWGLSLLVHQGAEKDIDLARAEAAEASIPLEIIPLPADVSHEFYSARLTLVRPDQFVCWRGDNWQQGVLQRVTGS